MCRRNAQSYAKLCFFFQVYDHFEKVASRTTPTLNDRVQFLRQTISSYDEDITLDIVFFEWLNKMNFLETVFCLLV